MGGEQTAPHAIDVLRTRLLPPLLPPSSLLRSTLVDRVVAGLEGRLVVITAAAGYGKSTLLAQALMVADRPSVWCSCDARLVMPGQLLAHIGAGVHQQLPHLEPVVRATDPPSAQVAGLANTLSAYGEHVIVALDDVHLLGGDAAATLELLLSDLPPNAHLALASRQRLPVPIARLRPNELVEIGEVELAFTASEAVDLLYAAGLATGPEQAAELHRQSEGWAAGLLIGAHAQRLAAQPSGHAQEHIFEYMGEEVLARQPVELREFLLATSILDRFTPEIADQLTDAGDSRRLARDLVNRHLFTMRLDSDEEWYRYHGMFLGFLRRRLAEETPERLAEMHLRAGEALVSAGLHGEGIGHLLAAGALEVAADALEPIAEQLVRTTQAHTLASWLAGLPEALLLRRPALLAAQGLLLHEAGDHEGALRRLEQAARAHRDVGDAAGAGMILLRMLQVTLAAEIPERGVDLADRLVASGGAECTPHAAWMSFACCSVWAILRRSAPARKLLVETATSGHFDKDTAVRVCGIDAAADAIEELTRERLAVAAPHLGGSSWSHRPLLAAFLGSRAYRSGGRSDPDESSLLGAPASLGHARTAHQATAGRPGDAASLGLTPPPIRILALGRLEVWRGSQPVADLAAGRAPKVRTLLAILLSASRPVHREALIELLWPTLPPKRALAALYTALHALRRALEPDRTRGEPSTLLVTDGCAYRLALERGNCCDAYDLLHLARGAGTDTSSDRTTRLALAEATYRGPFLMEWPYEDWATELRDEVESARAVVVEERAGRLLSEGDLRGAVERYRWLLEEDADRECVHRALMESYALSGERALAVRQYHACRAVLRERHGLNPSAETEALYRRLLN